MVYTPELFTDNSPMSPSQYGDCENPSARKSLSQCLDTVEVKPKTDVCRFCEAKPKRKAIRADNILFSSIPKRHSHRKINQ